MSVTKIRLSGLCARKRTRLSPWAATVMAKPSGRFRTKVLPWASEMRCGTSFDREIVFMEGLSLPISDSRRVREALDMGMTVSTMMIMNMLLCIRDSSLNLTKLGGGKPPFPTCDLARDEYLDSTSNNLQVGKGWYPDEIGCSHVSGNGGPMTYRPPQKSQGDVSAGTGACTLSRNLTPFRRINATLASTSSGVSDVPASWKTQSMSS
jgi:hypothetical protein